MRRWLALARTRRLRSCLAVLALLLLGPAVQAQQSAHGAWGYYELFQSDVRNENYLDGYLTSQGGKGGIAWSASATSDPTAGTSMAAPTETVNAYLGWTLHENTGGALGGNMIPAIAFVGQPLPAKLFLNVSRMVQLNIFVQGATCTNDGTGSTRTLYEFSLEARIGSRIWGGVPMGAEANAVESDPSVPLGWCLHRARFHSEISVLEKGEVPSFTLYVHHGSFAEAKVVLGLAGDSRSTLHIPFYPPEEYLLRRPEYAGPSQGIGGTAAPIASGLGLLLGLACLTRSRRPASVAVLLVAVALGGCSGKPADGRGDSEFGVEELGGSQEVGVLRSDGDNLTSLGASAGNGSILATVHDIYNRPLRDVHVSLADTSHFATTDGFGRFSFVDLAPGSYDYRTDHVDFKRFEGRVKVEADAVTTIDVTLEFRDGKIGDALPHLHGNWPANGKQNIMDDDIAWRQTVTSYGAEQAFLTCDTVEDFAILGTGFLGQANDYCYTDFALPFDPANPALVQPGTAKLSATVTWDEAPEITVQRVGLLFVYNGAPQGDMFHAKNMWTPMWPRENGQTTDVGVAWEMTDIGHQTFTGWQLRLWVAQHASHDLGGGPQVRAVTIPTKMHVKIDIERGVVPFEPGHQDFWGGADSLVIFDKVSASAYPWWLAGEFIPWNTTWVDITLERSREPLTHYPRLLYKAGDSPADYGQRRERLVPFSSEGVAQHVAMLVSPAQADIVYAKTPTWHFLIEIPYDEDEEILDDPVGYAGYLANPVERLALGQPGYSLTVTAYRTTPPADAVAAPQ